MQVSLNPLLANMVNPDKQSSFLTLGQFVKAIASAIAPILAAKAALYYGNWKLLFVIFAVVDVIAILYLMSTPIKEPTEKKQSSSFRECISLLSNVIIVLFFPWDSGSRRYRCRSQYYSSQTSTRKSRYFTLGSRICN